ncbi:MAG: family 43 glycosylhydrolase, partial [Clostridia bacterium]|nr:family 43 glycosylhydrolase [Clostridia bacterium]
MKNFLERVLLTSMIAVSCVTFVACGNGADEAKYGRLQDDTFFNTLRVDRMLGDPFLMEHDGYYYFTFSEGQQITVTKSSHMTQLTPGDENAKVIFRQADIGAQEIWAPEFFWLDGHFYCYFTSSRGANSAELDLNRRIWVMKSKTDDALGEWEKPQKIELPCDYWAIDATFFNWQGRQWILWSGWPYAENNNWEQRIYITELETGNPTKVKSLDPAARIQISKPIYKDWESVGAWMNEGPAVVVSPGGRPYCFYSTSSSQSNFYCMAYCTLLGETTEEMLANITNPETDAYGNSVGWRKEDK